MKNFLVSILFLSVSSFVFGQNGKTAYVDIYHILKKSPEYTEANLELEKRVKDWQSQINKKKAEVTKMKDALLTERALLTSQLIEEKEDEIRMVESELNTLQQEKFGTDGDYFNQHQNIYKPILDQIHTITNDIAAKKKYDVVLVKGDGNTMLYANKRNDITDLVLKEMERSRTRGKLSKKEIADLEAQDKIAESKERQRNKRDELRERQKDIESGLLNPSNTNENNRESNPIGPTETDAEKRNRINQERIAEAKKKQEEIRAAQLEKIEAQKLAIKKKQEELKLAREKAAQDALDRKNNIGQKSNSTQNSQKEMTEKQKEMMEARLQKAKEAKEKRDQLLAERKLAAQKRQEEAKKLQEERIQKMKEDKEKRLKELEERKKNN
ncbi:OmpH family outer membrane protein [Flavobacterium sp. I3-2]|uniref:OmpH family outer membrane protein n=1 Tax=Flavobacterium sp. I3-2 TaxID=2748319 RepID=UPI0015AB7D8C|nr:OmpH family outer membrane protein [Flavobacterium sp. I3-2]